MLLRYERHLKTEAAARAAAEEAAFAARATADAAAAQLADGGRAAAARSATLAREQDALHRERAALEDMRCSFEAQLQAARGEVAKAQVWIARHGHHPARAECLAQVSCTTYRRVHLLACAGSTRAQRGACAG